MPRPDRYQVAPANGSAGSIDAWDISPPYVQQLTAQYSGHVIETGASYGWAHPDKADISDYMTDQFNDAVGSSS